MFEAFEREIHELSISMPRVLAFLEVYSGKARISQKVAEHDLPVQNFELRDRRWQDSPSAQSRKDGSVDLELT